VSEGLQIALIVLLALFVGALLPLAISAFGLVKQAKKTLVVLEERSLSLTVKADAALGRANQIADAVQKELPSLQRAAQRVDELGGALDKLNETVRKVQAAGNIVGPAIAAGLNAYRLVKKGQNAQPVDGSDDLPEAVADAILAEIKSQAEANGDLPAPPKKTSLPEA